MRAFRIAFLLPLFVLIWLVTTGSMCPSGGPTESDGGRTADIQGFLEISPATPAPNERVKFEVSDLVTNGNPDAFAAWMIAIYGGEWTGPLPAQFQPGAANLVTTIEMEGPLNPDETTNVRYRYFTRSTYTAVLYLSSSTLNGNQYRSAKRTFSVARCAPLSVNGFKDTLTCGDGYEPQYRNLEDMGHVLQNPGVAPGSIPEAVVGEPFSFNLKALLANPGQYAAFSLEAEEIPTGLTVSDLGQLSGTPLASAAGLHWMRIRIDSGCSDYGPFGVATGPEGSLRSIIVRWPLRIVTTTCPSFDILPATLPGAALNEPYAQSFSATGGTPPVTFELLAGTLPPGLTFTGTGIEGTPNVNGEFRFTIRGTDSCVEDDARVVTRDYIVTVIDPEECPSLTSAGGSLEDGEVGVAYDDNLIFFDGVPPITTTLVSGALPPGLTVDPSTVRLTGIPTSAGDFNFRLRFADSCPDVQTIERDFDITINAAPGCTLMAGGTTTMPDGIEGVSYSDDITVFGGVGPFTMDISAGSLPPGLSLVFDGILFLVQGTPTTAGSYSFTARAHDSCTPPQEVLMPLSITIDPATACAAPPMLTITGFPGGVFGTPYDPISVPVTGGEPPLTFTVISGALPAGMTLSSDGMLGGTPTGGNGLSTFEIMVTDSCVPSRFDSATTQIGISGAPTGCTPLNVNPVTVQDATVGVTYEYFFSEWVSGGEGNVQFSASFGTGVPPGMTLDLDTGLLSGTPTTAGDYNWLLSVFDECDPPQNVQVPVEMTVN